MEILNYENEIKGNQKKAIAYSKQLHKEFGRLLKGILRDGINKNGKPYCYIDKIVRVDGEPIKFFNGRRKISAFVVPEQLFLLDRNVEVYFEYEVSSSGYPLTTTKVIDKDTFKISVLLNYLEDTTIFEDILVDVV